MTAPPPQSRKLPVLLAGLALALLAGLAWLAWGSSGAAKSSMVVPGATSGAPGTPRETQLVDVHERPLEVERAPGIGPGGDPAEALTEAGGTERTDALEFGTVTVLVRWSDSDEPAPGVMVSLRSGTGSRSLYGRKHQVTNEEGRVRFAAVEPGAYRVAVAEGISAQTHAIQLEPRGTAEVELSLQEGISVSGFVVDAGGARVDEAEILWLDSFGESDVIARTDATGAFAVRGILVDGALFARHPKECPSAHWECDVSAGTQSNVALQLRGAGASLKGVVVDEAGVPVPNARVSLGSFKAYADGPHGAGDADLNRPARRRGVTDPKGEFEFTHVAPIQWTLLVDKREFAPVEETLVLSKHTDETLRITLPPGGVVHGVVTDTGGAPVEDVAVFTWRDIKGGLRYSRHVRTDSAGAFELDGLPRIADTPFRAVRTGTPDAADIVLNLEASPRIEWNPTVAPPDGLTGVVVGPAGEPLADLIVVASGPGGQFDMASTGEDGAFALGADLGLARDISVMRESREDRLEHPGLPLHLEKDVLPAVSPIVIQVTNEDLATGSIEGRFIDESGEIPSGAMFSVELWGFPFAIERAFQADGSFTVAEIPVGEFEVRFTAPDRADWTGSVVVEAGKTSRLGELRSSAGGMFRWEPTSRKSSGWPKDLAVALTSTSGGISQEVKIADLGDQGPLAAGQYTLHFAAEGYGFAQSSVEVRDGETALAVVPAARAQEGRSFRVLGAKGAMLRSRVARVDGSTVLSIQSWSIDDPHTLTLPGLPDGDYVLHLLTLDQRTATHAFKVSAGMSHAEEVTLR